MGLLLFGVAGTEVRQWPAAVFELFRMLIGRVEMSFTEEEFRHFRRELDRVGLTLREIERVPHHDPESVS